MRSPPEIANTFNHQRLLFTEHLNHVGLGASAIFSLGFARTMWKTYRLNTPIFVRVDLQLLAIPLQSLVQRVVQVAGMAETTDTERTSLFQFLVAAR
jgi:hypothetical protein